jgi:peptide/nickel transport system permease protein
MAAPATILTPPQRGDDNLAVPSRPPRSLTSDALRQFRRHRPALAGSVVLGIVVVGTLLGPFVYTTPPTAMDVAHALEGPSLAHPLGTDDLGRDLLARARVGGRVSVAGGLVAMLIAVTLGTLIGAVAGFFGGFAEGVLMRLTDLFLALPSLPLLLLTIYLFRDELRRRVGPELGIFLLIVAVIGILNWMSVARLVRASFLSLKRQEFVEAARCVGAGDRRIMLGHILPNAAGPIIVAATIAVGAAIIAESSLSFLGLGFPPDVPTWGRLLFDAKNYLQPAPHWALVSGLLIFLTVLSINYIGDGLRDALDPRRH